MKLLEVLEPQDVPTRSFFISNAAKIRLVLILSIFRVVAYFRCLAFQNITVVAWQKMHKNIKKNLKFPKIF